jgi:valyl-tRNA synthetase
MLGDTAIAVHPKDKRYKTLIGKHAMLPIVNRRLPIIADEAVDREFGTGAVKVTPAHDPVDFQLGKKHHLEFINVMTDDAHMTNVPPAYEGLDRIDCRSKLIVDLEQQGFLGAIEEHTHNVGHCYRCHTVIEPRLSLQWFVRMKPLAEPAIKAVRSGTITFSPDRWTKVYLNWMENIQDWCISRQIWWGHRLPVYYCKNCPSRQETGDRRQVKSASPVSRLLSPVSEPGVIVSKTRPLRCPNCGNAELVQDEDVLDTWFSSWLWPFSTLGWPKKTKDLAYFYPTDTLVTAPEIIFFWVARMIMAGFFCMKKEPFTRVYIHGTVRDITGRKMSKSLGNIIDPLEMIGQYGTDALRYTLVTTAAVGTDIFLSEEKFTAGRNFANKLWNATRFALTQGAGGGRQGAGEGRPRPVPRAPLPLTVADRWILSQLQQVIGRVTEALEDFQINEAATTLYDFLWHDVCDWYVEISKIKGQTAGPWVLTQVLETSFRLLHPVMPFVTEELWHHLQGQGAGDGGRGKAAHAPRPAPRAPVSVMTSPWPKADKRLLDPEAERQMERLKGVVAAIRNIRAEVNVPLESRPPVRLLTKQPAVGRFFTTHQELVQTLARVGEIAVSTTAERPKGTAAAVVDGIEILIPLAGLIDASKERQRLQQRIEELTKQLSGIETRLRDKQFTDKAPKEVVTQTKERRQQVQETLKKLSNHLVVLETL